MLSQKKGNRLASKGLILYTWRVVYKSGLPSKVEVEVEGSVFPILSAHKIQRGIMDTM